MILVQGPLTVGSLDGTPSHTRLDPSRSSSDTSLDTVGPLEEDSVYRTLTENDSLIGFLIRRRQNLDEQNLNSFHSGVPVERVEYSKLKKTNSSKSSTENHIEELQINNEDLRRHIQQLIKELDDLKKENSELKDKLESSHTLFSDVGGTGIELLPELPPLEMPQFDFDFFEAQSRQSEEELEKTLGNSPL